MRHLLANIATVMIAALLVLGAALFGWLRSQQIVLTDEARTAAAFEPAPAHEFSWQELGQRSYVRNCVNCHGSAGRGRDTYPPIFHAGALFALPGGRDYLIDMHLWGLTSGRWGAPMPRMGHVPDAELAAVLNHVLTSFGNRALLPADAQLYVPSEIAERRGERLSPRQVNRRRPGGGSS
jgi:mono/diheme cytochrome c family protein